MTCPCGCEMYEIEYTNGCKSWYCATCGKEIKIEEG